MKHGGGMTWQPITYDPELNLIYVTTGNPQPVIAHKNRAGDNLFTGSIVALNADTGKMVWYFQSSPHDTHDWDSTQTAVLFDARVRRASRASSSRRRRATVTSSCSIATNGKALVSTRVRRRRTGPRATTRRVSRSPIRRRTRRSMARWSRRTRAARPTGRRRASVRRPASSTSARGAPIQRVLHLRSERQPAGLGRHRSRRLGRVDAAGDRLQDRQGALEPQVGGQHPLRRAEHGGEPRVHGRQLQRSRRAQCDRPATRCGRRG